MGLKRFFATSLTALLLVGCGQEAFDYEKASKEERETWLKPFAKGLHDGLLSGLRVAGALEHFYVLAPSISANDRKIVVSARLKSEAVRLTGQKSKMKEAIMRAICPIYMDTDLARVNVVVRTSILNANGSTAVSADHSPTSCSKTS